MKKLSPQFFGILLAATSVMSRGGAEGPSEASSSSEEKALPEMNQAVRDWLDSAGSEEFGKWLMQILDRKPDHAEWLTMFADILQGSQLSAKDGWFRKAVAQTRYEWKYLAARYDQNGNGTIDLSDWTGMAAAVSTVRTCCGPIMHSRGRRAPCFTAKRMRTATAG